jgi:hypothetical protein
MRAIFQFDTLSVCVRVCKACLSHVQFYTLRLQKFRHWLLCQKAFVVYILVCMYVCVWTAFGVHVLVCMYVCGRHAIAQEGVWCVYLSVYVCMCGRRAIAQEGVWCVCLNVCIHTNVYAER